METYLSLLAKRRKDPQAMMQVIENAIRELNSAIVDDLDRAVGLTHVVEIHAQYLRESLSVRY